jgi:hydroxypyruvate isomerase
MPQLSVCIEMFWPDLPYEDRIARVAELGFPAFEFWRWSNKDMKAIQAAMEQYQIPLVAMSLEPSASLIKRSYTYELAKGMQETARAARSLDCKTVIATVGDTLDDESYEASRRRIVRNLRTIGRIAQDHGLTLVLEPLNTLVDHHGYWLTRMSQAVDIVQEVDLPSVKILMDLYHQQITEGNLINNLRAYAELIGHIHTAGVPGRHELVGGEQDYAALLAAIDDIGYKGFVGLEYRPLLDPETSLQQALSLVINQ